MTFSEKKETRIKKQNEIAYLLETEVAVWNDLRTPCR